MEKQDNRVSLGYRLTQEDLINNRSGYLRTEQGASTNAKNIFDEMDRLERENPNINPYDIPGFQQLQTLYDEQIALE